MRNKGILLGFVLFSTIVCINSCEKNVSQPAPVPANCDTANLTYTNSMQVIINTYCGSYNTSCHSSGLSERGDFSNYATLQRYATGGQNSLYWKYIFIRKRMPLAPYLPLDACTSAKFKAWLLAGAPQ